jgi:hypothetical protein
MSLSCSLRRPLATDTPSRGKTVWARDFSQIAAKLATPNGRRAIEGDRKWAQECRREEWRETKLALEA